TTRTLAGLDDGLGVATRWRGYALALARSRPRPPRPRRRRRPLRSPPPDDEPVDRAAWPWPFLGASAADSAAMSVDILPAARNWSGFQPFWPITVISFWNRFSR